MLAELAAANAAYGVIKSFISNGKELASCGQQIAAFVGAKEKIEKEAHKKRAKGLGGADLEEFMALEQIREQEEQLKQIMIYAGRPGLWGDWQRFQAKARTARREAEVAAAKRRRKIMDWTLVIVISAALLATLVGFIFLLMHHQGKL